MNFDSTVLWYDRLSSLIYAGRILKSQECHLSLIMPGDEVLIVGGGTGHILSKLLKRKPSKITYLEKSALMLQEARKRAGHNAYLIEWMVGDENHIESFRKFDAILTFHLFSNYPPSAAEILRKKLDTHLKAGGLWLFTDFICSESQNIWQRIYTHSMIWLFRFMAGVKSKKIPGMHKLFIADGYRERARENFYNGYIESIAYTKAGIRRSFS